MQVAHSWLIKCKMDTCQAQQLSLTFLFAFSLEVTVTICLPVSFLCFWFLVKQLTRVLSLKNENEEKLMMCHIFNYLIKLIYLFPEWFPASRLISLQTAHSFLKTRLKAHCLSGTCVEASELLSFSSRVTKGSQSFGFSLWCGLAFLGQTCPSPFILLLQLFIFLSKKINHFYLKKGWFFFSLGSQEC